MAVDAVARHLFAGGEPHAGQGLHPGDQPVEHRDAERAAGQRRRVLRSSDHVRSLGGDKHQACPVAINVSEDFPRMQTSSWLTADAKGRLLTLTIREALRGTLKTFPATSDRAGNWLTGLDRSTGWPR
jgi:hypothetical protein